jgi:hypothetical protein
MADTTYYQPYQSESDSKSDSGSDSGSDTGSDSDYESLGAKPEIGSPVSLLRSAGPAFKGQKDSLLEGRTNIYSSINAAFAAPGAINRKNPVIPVGITKFDAAPQSKSTIINISSTDRDRNVYPNPTSFIIHLPRVYKNVTGFDIQQIKFLNSFFYFRNDKFNTFYDYIELCRPVPDLSVYPPFPNSNSGCNYTLRAQIREGSYNITTLLQELQYQLNTPPIFFYYPNGFTDFAALFAASGNYSLNFNQPGSYYFDSLNNVFVPNPTIAYIVDQFFPTQNAGLTFYTNENLLIAYYYPVLREVFLDPVAIQKIVYPDSVNQYITACQSIYERIVYGFEGLNDPVILELINANQNFLDLYRTQHTYLGASVNEYSFRIDNFNNRLTIYSGGLKKGIQNDFAAEKALYYQQQFANYGLDANGTQYNALTSTNQKLLATFTQMKDYVYTQMANYFAIPFNSYKLEQLVNYNTLYNVQNGINVANIPDTYIAGCNITPVPDYTATSPSPIQFDSACNYPTKNFTIVNEQICNVLTKDIQIDMDAADTLPDPSRAILTGINLLKNSNLQTNPKKRSLDIIANINPYEYTVFQIQSSSHQSIQVETLPKPLRFRYFPYMQACNSGTVRNYFTQSNTFVVSNYLNQIESNFSNNNGIVPAPLITTFGQSYNSAKAASSNYTLSITNKTNYNTISIPRDPSLSNTTIHAYPLNISIESDTIITSPLDVFIYADKSAYLNDAFIYYKSTSDSNYLTYLSSNWLFSNTLSNTSNITISKEFQASNIYYVILHSASTSFNLVSYNIFAWYSNVTTSRIVYNDLTGNSNYPETEIPYYFQPVECNADMYKTGRGIYTNLGYYLTNDRVYNELPIDSNLYAGTNPENNSFNNPLVTEAPAMGYDNKSNVSTDLTDYKGFSANSYNQGSIYVETVRCDPTNNYLFNFLSPYDSNAQQYITSTSQNSILTASGGKVYEPGEVAERQYKIVHWHDKHFIPPQSGELVPSLCNVSSNILPYSSNSFSNALTGYSFSNSSLFGGSNILQIGAVSGISFLPTDGSWDVETFMFKSAYLDQATDPNSNIQYIGIFDTQNITGYNISQINFSNALFMLARVGSTYYPSTCNVSSNFGFDPSLGAYHYFKVAGSNSNVQGLLSGYTQSFKQMLSRDRNFYSAIAFDSNHAVSKFYMLTGSLVPHPELSAPIAQPAYVDGSKSPFSNQSVIVPQQSNQIPSYIQRSVNDPYGSNGIYMSQYAQSLPIGTQTIQYQTALSPYDDVNGLFDYSPKSNTMVPLSYVNLKYGFIRDPVSNTPYLTFTTDGINNKNDCSVVNTFRIINESNATAENGVLRNLESFSYINYQNFVLPSAFSLNPTLPVFNALNRNKVVGFSENEKDRFLLALYWLNNNFRNGWHVVFKINNPFKQNITASDLTFLTCVPGLDNRTDFNPVNDPYKFFITNSSNYVFLYNSQSPDGPDGIILGPQNYNPDVFPVDSNTYPIGKQAGQYFQYNQIPTGQVGKIQSAWMNPRGSYFYSWGNSGPVGADGYSNSALLAINVNTFRTLSNYPSSKYLTDVVQFNFGNKRGQFIKDIKTTSDEQIYFIDTSDPYRIHKVQNREFVNSLSIPFGGNQIYNVTIYNITDTASSFTLPLPVTDPSFSWTITSDNTFFFQWTVNTPYGAYPWKISGNIGKGLDLNTCLQSAYQIFYPTMKIGLKKKTNYYNAITDANKLLYNTNLEGLATSAEDLLAPEFNRTYAFYYSNYSSMMADFSNSSTSNYKWGLESSNNYAKADTNFAGYVFNSYIYNIIMPASSNYSYIALRGSRPTQQYETILRITAPNRIDFGFNSLTDLIDDITGTYTNKLAGSSNLLSNYNPDYASVISAFDQQFILSNRPFGQGAITGFPGYTINSSNFSNFMSQLVTYYNQYTSNAIILNAINSNVDSNFSNYVNTYWSDILPSTAFTRANITDPIVFSLLFKSSIPTSYQNLDEQWGIGWNLGFDKEDTPYNTVHNAQSFYKIFDDYIFLRLNEEQGMNRVDYTAREHLDKTLDPQGTIQTYYGKLILNSFGNYCTTFVGNPVEFNPTIGRLDKLQIQWLDSAGVALVNSDCEWNAAIRITENIPTASVGSTLPSLKTGSQ